MACGYDTQTVLEMLFDIDTDNGIHNDRIRDDSDHDNSCSDSYVYEVRNHAFTFQYTQGKVSVKHVLKVCIWLLNIKYEYHPPYCFDFFKLN